MNRSIDKADDPISVVYAVVIFILLLLNRNSVCLNKFVDVVAHHGSAPWTAPDAVILGVQHLFHNDTGALQVTR